MDKAEYLVGELHSYLFMKRCVEKDLSVFDDQIRYCESKIKDADTLLSSGNAKGIAFGYVRTTATTEPLLSILAEQEKYTKRKEELLELKKQDPYGFKARVEYIESCLNKLDSWEQNFIIDVYCKEISTERLDEKYHYTGRRLRDYKKTILNKMCNISTVEINNVL